MSTRQITEGLILEVLETAREYDLKLDAKSIQVRLLLRGTYLSEGTVLTHLNGLYNAREIERKRVLL